MILFKTSSFCNGQVGCKRYFMTFIIIFALASIAGGKGEKKLQKWERTQIQNVSEIVLHRNQYFISLGIACHKYPDTALRLSQIEAVFNLPETKKIFIQSVLHEKQIEIRSNGKDETINDFTNLIITYSKSLIKLNKIHYRKLDQIYIGDKYYVSSIAYVDQNDMNEEISRILKTSSPRVKKFKENINKRFSEIYHDSLSDKLYKEVIF